MASLHWVPVDDSIAYAIASVEKRDEGKVEFRRTDPPDGVDPIVTLSVEEAEKVLPVSGDPSVAVHDLVLMADVNHPALLHNLRLRYEDDEIFTLDMLHNQKGDPVDLTEVFNSHHIRVVHERS